MRKTCCRNSKHPLCAHISMIRKRVTPELIKQCSESMTPEFIQEAVSHRIPMQVTIVVKVPALGEIYPQCPRCKRTMDREYMHFCDRCGQKLSWDYLDDAVVLYAPFSD